MKIVFPQILMATLLCSLFGMSQDNVPSYTSAFANTDLSQSIITNTENSENHKTLLAAMKASDLEEILSFDGPFTVFAPSDEAFDTLFESKTSNLFDPQNKRELQALLRYHIIAGEFTASKILKAMCDGEGSATFMTVQGEELKATMQGTDIVLTDGLGHTAKIIAADANQCNGVIHEIDSVILPKKISLLP